MIKKIVLIFSFFLFLNADDNLIAQKQNTLYVQNLIEIEENIAKMFEKYLLTEFKFPTLEELRTNEYLGTNFSLENKMGSSIAFEDISNLKIKYAITKNEYRTQKANDIENFIVQLYNRDLYRDYTSAYDDVDITKSYIKILLKSEEAKSILSILKDGKTIQKSCSGSLTDTYCNNNQKTFRWYNSSSQWIEYDKISLNNGNVTISSAGLLTDSKLNDLAVGTYIFVENTSKYVKLNILGDTLEILKVD
jgi:hypothetical protein